MNRLKIQDKEYPCRVTMGAMVRFKRESGIDIQQADREDLPLMLLFVWCCVKSACNADGVDFTLDFDRFADLTSPEDFADFFTDMADGTETEKKTSIPPTAEADQS